MFHVKIQLFVTEKSDQDPNPHETVSFWIHIEIKSWIRIRIEPVRIRNTGN